MAASGSLRRPLGREPLRTLTCDCHPGPGALGPGLLPVMHLGRRSRSVPWVPGLSLPILCPCLCPGSLLYLGPAGLSFPFICLGPGSFPNLVPDSLPHLGPDSFLHLVPGSLPPLGPGSLPHLVPGSLSLSHLGPGSLPHLGPGSFPHLVPGSLFLTWFPVPEADSVSTPDVASCCAIAMI